MTYCNIKILMFIYVCLCMYVIVSLDYYLIFECHNLNPPPKNKKSWLYHALIECFTCQIHKWYPNGMYDTKIVNIVFHVFENKKISKRKTHNIFLKVVFFYYFYFYLFEKQLYLIHPETKE